jgi:bifunctional UDP-N-acetylglucosamine pyrophosphorylase / glucosamine-1-phosphate N-acetyltransferase
MNLTTVILAAGKGKRMKNPDKSKVMFELNGKPMIEYVVDLALRINSDRVVLIVGHQKQSVIDFINEKYSADNNKISFAHQDEQLGTGHAIMLAEENLKDFDGDVLILSGDVPLLKKSTVEKFIDFHKRNGFKASLLSAKFDDPHGYGRVLRNSDQDFFDIREEKDCNDDERKCNEINSGIYIIDNRILLESLKSLNTNNAQGEYYLTDVFKDFLKKGYKIGAIPVDEPVEITGINTAEQLGQLEESINGKS